MTDYLYRFHAHRGGITLHRIPVLKETDLSWGIEHPKDPAKIRWITKGGKKQYANETIEKAREAYLARCESYQNHLRQQLAVALCGWEKMQALDPSTIDQGSFDSRYMMQDGYATADVYDAGGMIDLLPVTVDGLEWHVVHHNITPLDFMYG